MTQAGMDVVLSHIDAMRRRDVDGMASRLDLKIVHQGVLDELVCEGRADVLEHMRRTTETADFGIDHIEIIDAGERVVVGLAGARFRDVTWAPLLGQIFVVYSVRDGRITRMHDYRTRAEALAAVGATVPEWS
ncbi:MAG: hypothetical protein PVSMB7_03980 [Chloroflexota bacterium]